MSINLFKTVWDKGHKNSVPGLHTKVYANNSVYYLYYRTKSGIQRRPKIGDARILTIDVARKIAREWLTVVAQGGDPSKDRKLLKEEKTVKELFEATWKGHWDDMQFHDSGYSAEVIRNWKRNLDPYFGQLKLSEVTAASLREWMRSLKTSPYSANRSIEVLSRMFRYAEEMEWRPQNTNPCKLVKAHPETKRERYAGDEEIAKLGAILEREKALHPREVAFIYLLMYTGSRPRAIERALWDDLEEREINGQKIGILSLRGKSGAEKIYLPPQAISVIDQLKKVPGKSIAGNMPKTFWIRIRGEAGCPDLWARDLRRTFATQGMSEGFEMDVISELLNHKSTQTTKIYAKLKEEARHTIASKTATRMEQLLKGK